jgi:hypothetical protein
MRYTKVMSEFKTQNYLRVKGNEPLLLDDSKTVWVIDSGSMALFAVRVKDGVLEGTRHYLFSTRVGEALFGVAPNLNGNSLSNSGGVG